MLIDINQRKPYRTLVTRDFNARSSSWWSDGINTTEGKKLLSLTLCKGFQQIINEPTHIQRQRSSCIDLIFTDQPKLSVNSGIRTSLHPNYYYQIVQSKFHLNIFYPPPYQRLLWDYKKAELNELISTTKISHYENLGIKLNDPTIQTKSYRTVLNSFFNNKRFHQSHLF